MASRANTGGVAMIDTPPCVAKSRSGPRRCVVTRRARSRENRWRRLMDRVGRGVVIGRVAAVTRRGESRIIAIHMATGASHCCVSARQRKRSRAVIKLTVGPQNRVVAQLAGCGEACLDVIHWSCRRVVVLQVTGDAGSVCARQVVIVVDVAVSADAWRNSMRIRERETRG